MWEIKIMGDEECFGSSWDKARDIFGLHTYPHMHKQQMSVVSFLQQQQMHYCISEGGQNGHASASIRGEITTHNQGCDEIYIYI